MFKFECVIFKKIKKSSFVFLLFLLNLYFVSDARKMFASKFGIKLYKKRRAFINEFKEAYYFLLKKT